MLFFVGAVYVFVVFQTAKWCVNSLEVAFFYASLYSALDSQIWLAAVKLAVKLLRIFRRQVACC